MKFKVNVQNDYIYDIGYYDAGTTTLLPNRVAGSIPVGKPMLIESDLDQPRVLQVQGIGAILIQSLGKTAIPGYESSVPKSVQVTGSVADANEEISVTSYKYGALLRYSNQELYCMSDKKEVTLDVSIDKYGCLVPLKISSGSFEMIKLPEFVIR